MPDFSEFRTAKDAGITPTLDEIAREGAPFATVRLRQRVTKGAGSRRKGLLMAFKLLAMAERRWRRINAPQLVPLVRAGAAFDDGVAVERNRQQRAA